MTSTFLLTCEHAGNNIPPEYEHLFKGKEEYLYSHKAIDFGALHLAKHLAAATNQPLYNTTTSRLLVEANRSPGNAELFSDFTKHLPDKEKQILLATYYFPHRTQVAEKIAAAIAAGNTVYHLAIHTFTPVLAGEVREADIGILFDLERSLEEAFAGKLKEELLRQAPALKVLYNSPYPGNADGFPTYLRKKFDNASYAGFELEVNQKFFLQGDPQVWQMVVAAITGALQAAMVHEGTG